MTFESAVETILEVEKGLVIDFKDPGGATNFGISQRSYPDVNIQTLTKEQAVEIYERDYWVKLMIEKLPEILRLMFFDCAVNQGEHFAVTTLQNVLGVPADGLMGPKTIEKLPQFHDLDVLERYTTVRLERYIQNKNFSEFGVGWLRRLLSTTFKTMR